MSTNEPASPDNLLIDPVPDAQAQQPRAPVFKVIDPNDPPWRVPIALLVWIASVLLLLFVPVVAVIPYVVYTLAVNGSAATLPTDPNLIFFSILGVLPAHALTFVAAWLVVTAAGRRLFWQSLGWTWPKKFGPWKAIGLAVLLLALGTLLTRYLGGPDTQLDEIIKSSMKARFATAFLAAITGPLVEEIVYRGVLYAPLQRALGMSWAVVIVSTLFAGVHVLQYYNNLGVIAVISVLSVALTLVRARTGSVLPSYVMHLVFNGIQAALLVLEPFVGGETIKDTQPPIGTAVRSLAQFFS